MEIILMVETELLRFNWYYEQLKKKHNETLLTLKHYK